MDYQNPQIAGIYDLMNRWARDADFYLSLAVRPCYVLDLGLRYGHALLRVRRTWSSGDGG